MGYKIKEKTAEGVVVVHDCPSCDATLRSPIEEAGQRFPCPDCGEAVVTPGEKELAAYRERRKRRRDAAAKLEQERQARIAAERTAAELAHLGPAAQPVAAPTCSNCSRGLGRLEQNLVFRDVPVCAECYARLTGDRVDFAWSHTPRPPRVVAPALRGQTCKDCGGIVSKSASRCPHCGRVMHSFDLGRFLILFILVVVFLAIIGGSL